MKIRLDQSAYWNRAALSKTFSHPFHADIWEDYVDIDGRILDYGCGYGRTMRHLYELGYRNLKGMDNAVEMLKRARGSYPYLDFEYNNETYLPFDDETFDAVVLFAVLTCIPLNEDQEALMMELLRVLRPGGILYLSDILLNQDSRNQARYARFESKYEDYGTFSLDEGVVLRHFDLQRIISLLQDFELQWEHRFDVITMNGNRAAAFQVIAKKQ